MELYDVTQLNFPKNHSLDQTLGRSWVPASVPHHRRPRWLS